MPGTMEILVMPLAKRAMPVPLQIPEHHREQPRVLLVPWVCIRCLRMWNRVRRVLPLPMPPLSNAPLVRMKKLLPVMPDILGILVISLAKGVVPVTLQTPAQVLVQPRVLFVLLDCIRCLQTLDRAPSVHVV